MVRRKNEPNEEHHSWKPQLRLRQTRTNSNQTKKAQEMWAGSSRTVIIQVTLIETESKLYPTYFKINNRIMGNGWTNGKSKTLRTLDPAPDHTLDIARQLQSLDWVSTHFSLPLSPYRYCIHRVQCTHRLTPVWINNRASSVPPGYSPASNNTNSGDCNSSCNQIAR